MPDRTAVHAGVHGHSIASRAGATAGGGVVPGSTNSAIMFGQVAAVSYFVIICLIGNKMYDDCRKS